MTESVKGGAMPATPVPTDCDVSTLPGFMLDTVRLLGSELWALSTGDEFKAAVALWCRAWHQVPAASLPDDDAVLCSFAGYGRDQKGWRKVRMRALHGFMKCADGRLYHPVLAADALRAVGKMRERHDRTRAATEARQAKRHDERSEQRDVDHDGQRGTNVTKSHRHNKTINPQTPLLVVSNDELVWRNRLSSGPGGLWLLSWGPRPDEPGCQAPTALIAGSRWQVTRDQEALQCAQLQ